MEKSRGDAEGADGGGGGRPGRCRGIDGFWLDEEGNSRWTATEEREGKLDE